MMDSLLGMELPLPVKLIVAFVVVLLLIALATWIVRRIGGNRLGVAATRGRQPRLAVIDAAAVDGRRRLVLIRRDNVEHLVMIGGPSDVVIEQNIVRAVPVAAPRETSAQRTAGEETHRPAAAPSSRAPAESSRSASALADMLPPRAQPRSEPPPRAARPERTTTRIGSDLPSRPQPMTSRREMEPPPVDVHQAPPTADTNLSDMAHKLEAALRRPAAAPRRVVDPEATPMVPEAPPASTPEADAGSRPPADTAPAPRTPAPPPQAKPAASDAKPAPQKSVFDTLEEEMAGLLGKPPGKQ
jgi:flagellar protein FliO/FliZ